MKSYVFKVELEEEDGVWVAEVPVLPGCVSEGATPQEALDNVQVAARLYVEVLIEDGREIPVEPEVAVLEGAAVLVTS